MSSKRVAASALSAQPPGGAILMACVGAAAAVAATSSRPSTQAERREQSDDLEVYLMDKIARKPYLNYHSAPSSAAYQQPKRFSRDRQIDEHMTKSYDEIAPGNTRPQGVPSRLRLLTIDVPEFKKEAFGRGVCKLPSEIFDTDEPKFLDGVAPPKAMNKTLGHNERTGTRASRKAIVQKSLAKQLYYCYDPHYKKDAPNRQTTAHTVEGPDQTLAGIGADSAQHIPTDEPTIGVEILEASISSMNPNNIRRTYTSHSTGWKKKRYSYDPGKYTSGDSGDDANASNDDDCDDDESGVADADEAEVEEATLEQQKAVVLSQHVDSEDDDDLLEENDIDNPDYERTAPWNQYAWLEEIHLRINGIVPFGAPMQRAHMLSHWLYGRIYYQSIPSSPTRSGWLSWLWWPGRRTPSDGVDGEGENDLYGSYADVGSTRRGFLPWVSSKTKLNRASNKPHAVICDGAAMQRVPGSLRYVTKICREADIPLYILNDPRSWGSQTHSTLSDAIADLRKTVTDNVIRNALDLREDSAFERGRLVGKLEKEMAWRAYDAARKTREALMDARKRLRRDNKVEDWSDLTEEELWRKLIERKVIILEDEEDGKNESAQYSDAFISVCRHCLEEEKEQQSPANVV